tara:strand:- start:543 stop:941 length:399 start_codon:yes stop_codon:yes gene_type:complete
MLSYKNINLLDLRLSEDKTINNKDETLQIKSPIINFNIKDSLVYLNINNHSDPHNLFMNICGYIDRLFKITEISCKSINQNKIELIVSDDSKFYDENSKLINFKNVRKEGKIICSFICSKGEFRLKNFLLIK